jgi:succinoglycan biosynthesis protein ExoO
MPPDASVMMDEFDKTAPRVSLIVTAKDLERYIDAALWSARQQSLRDIEILVIDDGSADRTRAIIAEHAAEDPRIRILEGPGRGPAAARNIGIRAARGEWLAVLDGDDIMHPKRLELLLIAAVAEDADILADNQILFFEDGSRGGFLLQGQEWQGRRRIELGDYVRANTMFSNGAQLGYLKPLFRRAVLGSGNIIYDESLRIGEDYDLVARLLWAGAAFVYVPGAFYFYRRHQSSISFRLRTADIASLLAAANRFHAKLFATPELSAASETRRNALIRAGQFSRCVDSLKARSYGAAALNLLLHPGIWPLLTAAARDGVRRRLRARADRKTPIEAQTAKTRRFALLSGSLGIRPAALIDYLQSAGWQGEVINCAPAGGRLTADAVSPALLELVQNRGVDLVFYEDERLSDWLPYLLSPAARLARIVGQSDQPAGPRPVRQDDCARQQITLTAADIANPRVLAEHLAQVA